MELEKVLQERGSRYGTLAGNGKVAQALKEVVRADEIGWSELKPDVREAIDNIFQKIARAITGDPEYVDNWLDMEGYARLVRERIEKEKEQKERLENDPKTQFIKRILGVPPVISSGEKSITYDIFQEQKDSQKEEQKDEKE